MTTTSYHEEIKENVLFQLANEVMNTRDLQSRLGYPYPSLRRAMLELENDGKIIKFDNRARNSRYTLAPERNTKPKRYIPDISFKGKNLNLTMLYRGQGIEDVAINSADKFLKAWTSIAVTARRLHEGVPSDALLKRINRERVELTNARNTLEQIIFMMNQVLKDDKLWDPVYLANFPDDERWDEFLPHLEELYEHYFGEQNNG